MVDMTIHVDIPALEHLARVLETSVAGAIRTGDGETPQSAAQTAPLSQGEPKETTPQAMKAEAEETPQSAAQTAPLSQGEPKETTPQATKAEAPKYTLDQIMRAAAQMRDDGKLKDVTDMFGEFGIKRLSDLKDEQIQEFAGRLIGLGAKM